MQTGIHPSGPNVHIGTKQVLDDDMLTNTIIIFEVRSVPRVWVNLNVVHKLVCRMFTYPISWRRKIKIYIQKSFSQKSVDKESPDQNQINSRANSVEISGGMPLNRKMIIKLNKWRQNKVVSTAASITRGIRS